MRLSLQLNNFAWPGNPTSIRGRLKAIAQEAETAGFYGLWVMDHFFQIDDIGPVDDPMLEAYATLGYLAALTERVRLGVMVTGVVYRYPGILIKIASTLDVLCGGRSYFGIGAAWFEREARGLGVPYLPQRGRYEQLEETLQIARQMWSGKTQAFHGKHYQLEETLNRPQPLAQPHPTILVGGTGEQKTLRLVAQYADACNLWFPDEIEEYFARKFDILRKHCEAAKRDFDAIEKTVIGTIDLKKDSPKSVIQKCLRLASVGIQHWIVEMPRPIELYEIVRFQKEIIPAISEL